MTKKWLHTVACWPNQGAYLNQWRRNINPGCLHFRGHAGGAGASADCQSITAAGNRGNLPQEGWRGSATLTKVALVPLQTSHGVGHGGRWLAPESRSNKRQPWGVWNSGGWEWGDIQGRPTVITGGDKAPTRGAAAVVHYLFSSLIVQHHLCQEAESLPRGGGVKRGRRQWWTRNQGERTERWLAQRKTYPSRTTWNARVSLGRRRKSWGEIKVVSLKSLTEWMTFFWHLFGKHLMATEWHGFLPTLVRHLRWMSAGYNLCQLATSSTFEKAKIKIIHDCIHVQEKNLFEMNFSLLQIRMEAMLFFKVLFLDVNFVSLMPIWEDTPCHFFLSMSLINASLFSALFGQDCQDNRPESS